MADSDSSYLVGLEQRLRALIALRPPSGMTAYRLVLLALGAPLDPDGPAGEPSEA